MFGMDGNTIKGGFMTTMTIEIIRGILNGALKNTSPKMLLQAIREDASLWGSASGDIAGYAKNIPFPIGGSIKNVREIVDTQFGGFDTVVLKWLSEDHPIYYNIIINTPEGKGKIWLKKQIDEVLDGVQNGNS
jgi:hypothetical protein